MFGVPKIKIERDTCQQGGNRFNDVERHSAEVHNGDAGFSYETENHFHQCHDILGAVHYIRLKHKRIPRIEDFAFQTYEHAGEFSIMRSFFRTGCRGNSFRIEEPNAGDDIF